jgi:hypothetical protein
MVLCVKVVPVPGQPPWFTQKNNQENKKATEAVVLHRPPDELR